MTSIDQFVGLHAQMNEIFKRVGNGSLDPALVKRALQDIIEGKSSVAEQLGRIALSTTTWTPPAWYKLTPEQQLRRIGRLNATRQWGFAESDFPSDIPEFTPCTPTEVLMLAVYLPNKGNESGFHRTFDELWKLVRQDGSTTYRCPEFNATPNRARQVPGYEHRPGIRWVVFDSCAYRGKSPEAALTLAKQDDVQLAGVEVLMAAVLFPDWVSGWSGADRPNPILSGIQVYWHGGWSYVPYFFWETNGDLLRLDVTPADDRSWRRASFSLRELS